jgi:hypothetical protein
VRRLVVAALGLGALSLLGACRAPSAPSVAARVAVAPAAGVAWARALVPACARAGVALEAPVARADLDGGAAEVAALLEEAAARGVPIALRPIAADGVGGPAISSGALPDLSSDVERLVAIIAAAPPPRATLVVELAPPRALAVEVIARLDASSGAGRGGRLYELLGMRLDERGHVADAARLGAIVAGARAGGVAVEARLWPILVDDGRDGDSALGDALDVPVLARAGTAAALPAIADAVDVVRLVATRSLWLRAVAPADDSALAGAVAALARALAPSGARVGVALGAAGVDGLGLPGVATPAELAADVAAARAAGIDDVVLDELSAVDAADAWLAALTTPSAARPAPTPAPLDDLRAAVRDADRLLGWR